MLVNYDWLDISWHLAKLLWLASAERFEAVLALWWAFWPHRLLQTLNRKCASTCMKIKSAVHIAKKVELWSQNFRKLLTCRLVQPLTKSWLLAKPTSSLQFFRACDSAVFGLLPSVSMIQSYDGRENFGKILSWVRVNVRERTAQINPNYLLYLTIMFDKETEKLGLA